MCDNSDLIWHMDQAMSGMKSYLADFEERREVVPYVVQSLEALQLARSALADLPNSSSGIVPGSVRETARSVCDYWVSAFDDGGPSLALVSSPTAATIATGSGLYSAARNAATAADETVCAWGQQYLVKHKELELRYDRATDIERRIAALGSHLVELHRDAVKAFRRFQASAEDAPAVAVGLRTLLEQTKGELLSRAEVAQVAKTKQWSTIADKLAVDEIGARTLRLQQDVWADLFSELSEATHGREGVSPEELLDLFNRTMTHLFEVLGSLDSASL